MSRYIDADKLTVYFEALAKQAEMEGLYNMAHIHNRCLRIIEDAPTADVVEVVRCKDCEQWHIEGYDPILERTCGTCQREYFGDKYGYREADGNDFCSYGERREG